MHQGQGLLFNNPGIIKLNKSRSRFGKNYNLVFLIVKIQKIGGKFEFILLKTLGCKFSQNGTSIDLPHISLEHSKLYMEWDS